MKNSTLVAIIVAASIAQGCIANIPLELRPRVQPESRYMMYNPKTGDCRRFTEDNAHRPGYKGRIFNLDEVLEYCKTIGE